MIAEQKTGRLIGDIIIAGPTNHQILTDLNYLEPFKTSQWAQMIPELLPDIPNANPLRASIFSIAINTKLIPPAEEPKVWADLLQSRFKGEVGLGRSARQRRRRGNGCQFGEELWCLNTCTS